MDYRQEGRLCRREGLPSGQKVWTLGGTIARPDECPRHRPYLNTLSFLLCALCVSFMCSLCFFYVLFVANCSPPSLPCLGLAPRRLETLLRLHDQLQLVDARIAVQRECEIDMDHVAEGGTARAKAQADTDVLEQSFGGS